MENLIKDRIILYSKPCGVTSFTSLNKIKKALGIKKVGHAGTLDSFAKGLLVCTSGRLTRLISYIQEESKEYIAVVLFGFSTTTLEYTGEVIKTSSLPTIEKVKAACDIYKGDYLQTPPIYSAIHINGERASDRVRRGEVVEMKKRRVVIYDLSIMDKVVMEGKVKFLMLKATVSSGTYIRSLVEDIAKSAGVSATLLGLYRTRIGQFRVEKSFNYNESDKFSIQKAVEDAVKYFENEKEADKTILNMIKDIVVNKKIDNKNSLESMDDGEAIFNNSYTMTEEMAAILGFSVLKVKKEAVSYILNGSPLSYNYFDCVDNPPPDLHLYFSSLKAHIALFSFEDEFIALVSNKGGVLKYDFVY